jgi:hypothetical protein
MVFSLNKRNIFFGDCAAKPHNHQKNKLHPPGGRTTKSLYIKSRMWQSNIFLLICKVPSYLLYTAINRATIVSL